MAIGPRYVGRHCRQTLPPVRPQCLSSSCPRLFQTRKQSRPAATAWFCRWAFKFDSNSNDRHLGARAGLNLRRGPTGDQTRATIETKNNQARQTVMSDKTAKEAPRRTLTSLQSTGRIGRSTCRRRLLHSNAAEHPSCLPALFWIASMVYPLVSGLERNKCTTDANADQRCSGWRRLLCCGYPVRGIAGHVVFRRANRELGATNGEAAA